MDLIIIIIVQLIFTILLGLFVRYNYKKIDNWFLVLVSAISLIPVFGGIIILATWAAIFFIMADEHYLSDTKINRFLFKSKFKE